ncbi:NAD(P)H nitroreductase [Mycolicibacterium celeriflavum]|uniref:Acg family FMN-binding oxidoreductase n=1 Tax=Mycolicibacterium celeriflavum TaxID=1249101 RepID=UPI0007FC7DC3|nr:NAD(P)H nitroreductase [Mycolicibacterium celeriflavum]OBG19876.1 NAD(P)H nitroreductase [Mycolicibacterium celeriflavum]
MTKATADTELIAKAVQLACRAPSLHNSQPWRWVATKTTVDLFADPHRVVRSSDNAGREAIIGCGAALDHFRVAMAAAGWNTTVEPFPDPNRLDHLAAVGLTPVGNVAHAWRDRADAIRRRRTDRLPFRAPENWESFKPALRTAWADELVTLDVLGDEARPQLAEASRFTERVRRYDEFYHREMDWWTASFRKFEGVPQSSLVSSTEGERVGVNRQFPVGGHGRRRSAIGRDKAKILVLSTPEDTRLEAFRSGQALSAVLLECTMAGLATCPLTHITEVKESRQLICDLIGRTVMPQILIRVGTAPHLNEAAPQTPRRPLREVLEIRR